MQCVSKWLWHLCSYTGSQRPPMWEPRQLHSEGPPAGLLGPRSCWDVLGVLGLRCPFLLPGSGPDCSSCPLPGTRFLGPMCGGCSPPSEEPEHGCSSCWSELRGAPGALAQTHFSPKGPDVVPRTLWPLGQLGSPAGGMPALENHGPDSASVSPPPFTHLLPPGAVPGSLQPGLQAARPPLPSCLLAQMPERGWAGRRGSLTCARDAGSFLIHLMTVSYTSSSALVLRLSLEM